MSRFTASCAVIAFLLCFSLALADDVQLLNAPLLTQSCGAKSAAAINKLVTGCANSLQNTTTTCSKACLKVQKAILKGDDPTRCQRATVALNAFTADKKTTYIKVYLEHADSFSLFMA